MLIFKFIELPRNPTPRQNLALLSFGLQTMRQAMHTCLALNPTYKCCDDTAREQALKPALLHSNNFRQLRLRPAWSGGCSPHGHLIGEFYKILFKAGNQVFCLDFVSFLIRPGRLGIKDV